MVDAVGKTIYSSVTDKDVGNQLFIRADKALLAAKKSGKNCTCCA